MPRHKELAERLAPILAYRNRPEGDLEPLQTNWTTVPANDNANPEEIAEFGRERVLLVTPSVKEIMEQVHSGKVIKNDADQIIGIGKLRFSDGTKTERAYCYGVDDKVIQYDRLMPVGSMLGTTEKAKQASGGRGYTQAQLERSNDYFAETLGTIAPRYIKRAKRRNGRSLTASESRVVLEEAISNTKEMPAITYLAPGLPCGTERIADCFLGMQKANKGVSGAMLWQDIASAKVHREIWDEALAAMKKEDIAVLDAAMDAKTLADISPGGTPKGARKRGKRMLYGANDNLDAELKKASA